MILNISAFFLQLKNLNTTCECRARVRVHVDSMQVVRRDIVILLQNCRFTAMNIYKLQHTGRSTNIVCSRLIESREVDAIALSSARQRALHYFSRIRSHRTLIVFEWLAQLRPRTNFGHCAEKIAVFIHRAS